MTRPSSLSAFLPLALCCLVAPTIPATASAAAPTLEPGLWKVTFHSSTDGKANPVDESSPCLRDELADVAAYFAPALEELQAECKNTRQPSTPNEIAYRMHCVGRNFTIEALTKAVLETSHRFTVSLRVETKTARSTELVVGSGTAVRTGECPPSGESD
jgi:hypothetical protein